MNDEEKNNLKIETQQGLQYLKNLTQRSDVDLIVVDEILGCIQNGLIKEQDLIEILVTRKATIEVALSGRYLSPSLEAVADLVSEINNKKHYFETGQIARKGIDY